MTSFRLEFEQGGQIQTVSFDGDSVSLGRDRSSDFVLDHPTVSRQHALIVREGPGDFVLVVLSRGGLTAVDGQPVQSSEISLYDGTSITLGKYSVRFRSDTAPRKPAGQPPGGAMGSAPMPQQPAGGVSQQPAGGVSQQPAGGVSQQPEAEPEDAVPEKEDPMESGAAGIQSWDEIAASEAAREKAENQQAEVAAFRQARDSNKGQEETNPALVGAAVVGIVVLLGVALLAGGGDDGADDRAGDRGQEDRPPVEVSIECHDEASCLAEAEHNYERGVDLIERREVETANLFDGYHRLVKVKASLEEGGIEEIPEQMDQLQSLHDEAREELDGTFSEFRMQFHQASQQDEFHRMADVIDDIQTHFPEHTAYEYRWAREREREMQAQGVYPRQR